MAKLTVKLHGQIVTQIVLEDGCEYIAGRAADAQIKLADERGISRHHLKFYQQDNQWICESLSKFVLTFKDGTHHTVLALQSDDSFGVTPYEFSFEEEPTLRAPRTAAVAAAPSLRLELSQTVGEPMPSDATVAGSSSLVPYLRIVSTNAKDAEVLKLEGQLWIIGRDPNCEIPIDSQHVSRRHLELARTTNGFYLTDLGSSNGTKINGQYLQPHEPMRLDSGDEIAIKTVVLVFEIRDVNFSSRLDQLPTAPNAPASFPMPTVEPQYLQSWSPEGSEDLTVVQTSQEVAGTNILAKIRVHLQSPEKRKRTIRLSLMALIPILMVALLQEDKPKATPEQAGTEGGSGNVAFDKLTVDKKSLIKDSFNLARNLYVQGKYELCLTELAKVHEQVPLFENSKELESFCVQGKELVHRQRDLDRKESERQAIESQIAGYVETCKSNLKTNATVDETRLCLADAIELNPEHGHIVEMIHSAQLRQDERELMSAQRKAEKRQAAKGTAQYKQARNLYQRGQLAESMVLYEKFIRTPYPRLDDVKSTAKRELASIKGELQTKVSQIIESCNALAKKDQFKEAYGVCDQAVQADPDNEQAEETRRRMKNELRRIMKSIYEDSVLEESLGNVDSAKERWKKIVAEDLANGEYAVKAKSKLLKYGLQD